MSVKLGDREGKKTPRRIDRFGVFQKRERVMRKVPASRKLLPTNQRFQKKVPGLGPSTKEW